MDQFELLSQQQEDALHATRLLNVEEKPFRRLTKRLLAANSLISAAQTEPLELSPDASAADEDAAAHEMQRSGLDQQREQWRGEAFLDFAAFESNVVRVQFLLNSNERERERYAAEKDRILETAQNVRDHNAQLHEQLKEAQRILATRKSYDELAEKITSNRMLKTRDDQHLQLEKLNSEITELERESEEYAKTWAERRDQFGKIVEEGMQMLRLIRDEKEEAERKEGMEQLEDGEDAEASKTGGSSAPTPLHIGQEHSDHHLSLKEHAAKHISAAPSPSAQYPAQDLSLDASAGTTIDNGDEDQDNDASSARTDGPEEGEEEDNMDTT